MEFTAIARLLGLYAAAATVVLTAAYAVTLVVGFLSLESPDQPIGNPMFTILEVLIIVIMPAMVGLMIAVHAWAPTSFKALTFAAVVFMGLLAGLTISLHFVILTVSREPEFAGQPWLPLVLGFKWPSVAYALDILAWDVFFALSMLFAAPVFRGSRLAAWIRWLMVASGVLALAGLSGVAFGDMQLRNIGIVGYVPAFLVVAALLGVLFYRTAPCDATTHARVPLGNELAVRIDGS
jgi:hypothetical protein